MSTLNILRLAGRIALSWRLLQFQVQLVHGTTTLPLFLSPDCYVLKYFTISPCWLQFQLVVKYRSYYPHTVTVGRNRWRSGILIALCLGVCDSTVREAVHVTCGMVSKRSAVSNPSFRVLTRITSAAPIFVSEYVTLCLST